MLSQVLAHHHPPNRFFWPQPATPEAAGCFHLSSRWRLCCHQGVNITLLHSWGYIFTYKPSSLPPTSALELLLLHADMSLTWRLIFDKHSSSSAKEIREDARLRFHTVRAQNSMTSHLPAINMLILSKFRQLLICSKPFPAAKNPRALAEGRQEHYLV